MTTSERVPTERLTAASALRRRALAAALLIGASLALCAVHMPHRGWAAPPLPTAQTQDNALIFGVEVGGWGAPERGGVSAALWIGLMNRVWSWLDAELGMGAVGLFGSASDTFSQSWRGRSSEQRALWGGGIRGGVRAHSAALGGLGVDAGLRISVLAAPLQGTLTRAEVEVGLSLDCWRDDRAHGVASILYLIPLWEGLTQEPGLAFTGPMHAALARFSFGF